MLNHCSVYDQLKMKVTDSPFLHGESMEEEGGKENAILLFDV